jgi:hypothetical protein
MNPSGHQLMANLISKHIHSFITLHP